LKADLKASIGDATETPKNDGIIFALSAINYSLCPIFGVSKPTEDAEPRSNPLSSDQNNRGTISDGSSHPQYTAEGVVELEAATEAMQTQFLSFMANEVLASRDHLNGSL
jgi:hypothetical protein